MKTESKYLFLRTILCGPLLTRPEGVRPLGGNRSPEPGTDQRLHNSSPQVDDGTEGTA